MKTTFSRTLFALAAILLAVLLAVGFSFQLLVRNYMEGQAMSRLKKNCNAIVQVAAAEPTLTGEELLVNLSVVAQVTGTDTVICDANGTLVVCSEDPVGCQHRGMVVGKDYLKKVLSQDYLTSRSTLEGLYDDPRYVVAAPIRSEDGQIIGLVISSAPMTATAQVLRRLSDRFLIVSLATVVVASVVVTIYAKKHSSPLKEMSNAATSFGHGNLKARVKVPEKATTEVQELALAFNNMAASLEKSEYQRQEFIANVSHELKTPMTTIAGYVDGILDGTIPKDQQEKYLQVVSSETKRLSRLVRSMLDISRLQEQASEYQEKMTRFELSECIGQTLISFEKQINDKKIQMEVELPERPVYVRACRDHITQVLYNLTDNAVKFCPQGGEIGVAVELSGEKAYVSIFNNGQPIPKEELPLLFDRFHKLDKSRSENREGWGLGLHIVKTIIGLHGEDISVTSSDGGTEFTFTLTLVN